MTTPGSQERIIVHRLKARERLGLVLVAALVISLGMLLILLTGAPNAALTALLGAAVGGLASALVSVVNAVSTSDKQDAGSTENGT